MNGLARNLCEGKLPITIIIEFQIDNKTNIRYVPADNFEEARDNLRDAIEGNLVVALQLGFEIPQKLES